MTNSWDQSGQIPKDWFKSLIMLIYKNGGSLASVSSKFLASVILRRLSNSRKRCMRDNQAGLLRDRSCVDEVFILRWIVEYECTFTGSMFSAFSFESEVRPSRSCNSVVLPTIEKCAEDICLFSITCASSRSQIRVRCALWREVIFVRVRLSHFLLTL